MGNLKVSIVIPAYNIEDYVERCIVSVTKQTHKNIEILVVDDGSTDHTGQIIDQLAKNDSRIKVFHKENGGVSSARNLGIQNATGDYIGFVDGDDCVEEDMYEHLLENAVAHNADIAHCGYRLVYPNGRIQCMYGSGKFVVQDNTQGLIDLIEGSFIEPGLCNKLFQRKLFTKQLEEIDGNIKINEDFLMNYYLFRESKKSVYEDFCPYHYMLRKGSASRGRINKNRLCDPIKVTHIIVDDTRERKKIHVAAKQRLFNQLVAASTLCTKEQSEDIKRYRKEYRQELRKNSSDILKGQYNKKLKLKVLWASIWPFSYMLVHMAYAKLTGIEKKNNVE